ncbi:hypothetical protein [Amycolatopsis orientalis]|nr:hypothetical protein [Amycolatopsis orientalis]
MLESISLMSLLVALVLAVGRTLPLVVALRGTRPTERAEIIRALNPGRREMSSAPAPHTSDRDDGSPEP